MPKQKLQKFDEFRSFSNTLEYDEPMAAKILQKFLAKNTRNILELGCGRGDYTLSLAEEDSKTSYIGIDIQGERLWYGAKRALENKLDNVMFYRSYVDKLFEIIPVAAIDEIWITFPDPYPKARHAKRRLTSPKFLDMYKDLLKPGGRVNLKTDNADLLEYSLGMAKVKGGVVERIAYDIYEQELNTGDLAHQTHFEKKHLEKGRTIKIFSFRFDDRL